MALATADIHVKVDPAIKKQAEKKFKEDGITMSDFVNIILRQYLRSGRVSMNTERLDLPENLRINSKAELKEFLEKRLAENEENGKYYTISQIKEDLAVGRLEVSK